MSAIMSSSETKKRTRSQQSEAFREDREQYNAATDVDETAAIWRKEEILRARARALARRPDRKVEGAYLEVIEFQLASETFAFESIHIREVYPLKDLTPLPCVPRFFLGMMNIRGQILAVIDIRRLFELPEEELTPFNTVIILQTGEMELGILADTILGMRQIPMEEIQPALPTLSGLRAEHLLGVACGTVVVLDAAKLLADRRLIVHEEVG